METFKLESYQLRVLFSGEEKELSTALLLKAVASLTEVVASLTDVPQGDPEVPLTLTFQEEAKDVARMRKL